nr:MAG TPA: hypothetical protein [Caudoviricetes sp.]
MFHVKHGSMFHVKHSSPLHVVSDDAGDHGLVVALGDCPQEKMTPRVPRVVRVRLAYVGSCGPKAKGLQNVIGHGSFCHCGSLPYDIPKLPFQHGVDFYWGEICKKIVARPEIKLLAHGNIRSILIVCGENVVDVTHPMLMLELLNMND